MAAGDYWSESAPVSELREAVGKAPDEAQARINLAHGLLNEGQEAEALEQFREAIRLADDQPVLLGHAHLFVGDLLANDGQLDAAIREFEVVLQFRPRHVTAHWMLGCLFKAKGKLGEARQHWKAVVQARDDGLVPDLHQVSESRRLLAEHPEA